MSGHTYDKWLELGYQVKRGEAASYVHYGKKIFTEKQVMKLKKNGKRDYQNRCWKCHADVDSNSEEQCDECNWLSCSRCGACGCDYDKPLEHVHPAQKKSNLTLQDLLKKRYQ